MSSNNNPRSQGNNNQGSQESKSPSQESSKPASSSPETAGNQQQGKASAGDMINEANAKNKQGTMDQPDKAAQSRTFGDQEADESENTGSGKASKASGTR